MNINLSASEEIVAKFKPSSIISHIPYLFGFRDKLVLTNRRVILLGFLPFLDREIAYQDISDIFINDETGALEITKKGVRPTDSDPVYESFKAYLACSWLNEPDKVISIIKSFLH